MSANISNSSEGASPEEPLSSFHIRDDHTTLRLRLGSCKVQCAFTYDLDKRPVETILLVTKFITVRSIFDRESHFHELCRAMLASIRFLRAFSFLFEDHVMCRVGRGVLNFL